LLPRTRDAVQRRQREEVDAADDSAGARVALGVRQAAATFVRDDEDQSEQQLEIASHLPSGLRLALCAPPGGFATHVTSFTSKSASFGSKTNR
jgi:hypothetical protein